MGKRDSSNSSSFSHARTEIMVVVIFNHPLQTDFSSLRKMRHPPSSRMEHDICWSSAMACCLIKDSQFARCMKIKGSRAEKVEEIRDWYLFSLCQFPSLRFKRYLLFFFFFVINGLFTRVYIYIHFFFYEYNYSYRRIEAD